MGDIARCSLGKASDYYNEELLYKLFGINAELLIDHAWGVEPCTVKDVKGYKPTENSVSSGQVLQEPYPFEKARLIVKEMADFLSMDLFAKGLVTDKITLMVGYDVENLTDGGVNYKGEIKTDRYGRKVPKESTGSQNLGGFTSSTKKLVEEFDKLFARIADKNLFVRRLNLCAAKVVDEGRAKKAAETEQLTFFDDKEKDEKENELNEKERKRQKAVLEIRKKYGSNAVLKGMNFSDGATGKQRNKQIGGHKA